MCYGSAHSHSIQMLFSLIQCRLPTVAATPSHLQLHCLWGWSWVRCNNFICSVITVGLINHISLDDAQPLTPYSLWKQVHIVSEHELLLNILCRRFKKIQEQDETFYRHKHHYNYSFLTWDEEQCNTAISFFFFLFQMDYLLIAH